MAIKNVMEIVVRDVLMANKNDLYLTCTCTRCLDDVMASALNNLPPRYIVNEDHQPYVRVMHEANQEGAIAILKTVTQSASMVSKNPRCDAHKQ